MKPLTLAFSGGGAKCAAQAGVLAVLAEAGLPVSAVAGVSAGGLVALLHGLGFAPPAIRDAIAETHLFDVWELDPTRQALFGAPKVRARAHALVGDRTFADLKLPVVVGAVDLRTGREARLTSGRLDDAIVATMAIPGLFAPVAVREQLLVDGGVLNPLPVDVARALGPRVVAVDVLADRPPLDAPPQLFETRGPMRYATEVGRRLNLLNMIETVHQAGNLMTHRMCEYALQRYPPDVLLEPPVGRVGLFAFDLAPEAYYAGQASARAALPALEALAHPRLTSPSAWRAQLAADWRQFTVGK
jgi:NTE family protein